MSISILSTDALDRALALRDLADPAHGPHALQLLVDRITGALEGRWGASCASTARTPWWPSPTTTTGCTSAPAR